jgi:hypothetical protein
LQRVPRSFRDAREERGLLQCSRHPVIESIVLIWAEKSATGCFFTAVLSNQVCDKGSHDVVMENAERPLYNRR